MPLRTTLRYVGLIFILLIFIMSGFQQIANPGPTAALLAKSNFPKLLRIFGVQYRLRAYDYNIMVQGAGAVFIGFSLFLLLGVGRAFFAFLLALITMVLTIVFHINIDDPSSIKNEELFHFLKNLSITGALLFVAGSGHRWQRYSQLRDYDEEKKRH